MSRTSASTPSSELLDTISFFLKLPFKSSLFNIFLFKSSLLLNFSVPLGDFVKTLFLLLFYFISQSSSHSFHSRFFISFHFFININYLFILHLSVSLLRFGHRFNKAFHYGSNRYDIILICSNIHFLLSLIFFTRIRNPYYSIIY